jgi:uncharacterized membrane protein
MQKILLAADESCGDYQYLIGQFLSRCISLFSALFMTSVAILLIVLSIWELVRCVVMPEIK